MSAESMKAVMHSEFGPANVLFVGYQPKPVAGPAEVLVRVAAAGVNPIDVQSRAGDGFTSLLGQPPYIPGWDVSGIVEEIGYGVTSLEAGDAVMGMLMFPYPARAYAEYVVAPSRQFVKKPSTLSFEEAAAFPLASLTAYQVLTTGADVRADDKVLVHGAAGGVGHLMVQIAKSIGSVCAVTARASRAEWLKELGAIDVFDLRADSYSLQKLASIDVVVDLVGEESTSSSMISALPKNSRFVGVADGVSDDVRELASRRSVLTKDFLVEPDSFALESVVRLILDGELKVHVAKTFTFADAPEAHRLQESGNVQGKIVLVDWA